MLKKMRETLKKNIAIDLLVKAYELQLQGDTDQAIQHYIASIDVYPTPEAHTFLGMAYSIDGKYEDAIFECELAIGLDPAYGNPYNDIGMYMIKLNRYDEALSWLLKTVKETDYEAKHYSLVHIGQIYELKGLWYEALASYDKALEQDTGFEQAKISRTLLISRLN